VQALGADLDFEQTEQIAREFAITPGSVTAEGGRVAVLWDVDRLIVRDVTPMAPFRHPLTLPGETYADEFGWMITAFHTDLPQDTPIPPRNTLGAVFAADDLKGPLYFRNHQSGDLMQPAGFNGRRKLADLLSETKLSLAIRQRLPVVCDLIGPIWVPGVCYDERIRSTSKSRTGLHLSFGPIPSNASHN
jgi:tRNA(Ile)-lysidine synthase